MVFSWLHLAIIIFFLVGIGMSAGPLGGSLLLSPWTRGGDTRMPYECGMRPMGSAWMRFGINYYIYALLFLAFDVDVLYLFPVALYYPQAQGILVFFKVLIFLTVLAAAVVYFWAKGVFSWPKRIS